MIKALFLDRDGVINEDLGYVCKVKDFHFIRGVFEALKGFVGLGFMPVVITNQSGIGRGYYSEDDYKKINSFMLEEFRAQDIEIFGVYYCPHAPEENCFCRKPAPGMFLRAAKELNIDLKNSIMVGDKDSDIAAAKAAGVYKTYKVGTDSSCDAINLNELYKKLKLEIK